MVPLSSLYSLNIYSLCINTSQWDAPIKEITGYLPSPATVPKLLRCRTTASRGKDLLRHVACNVQSTPRVSVVRKCIVNVQSVLFFSVVIYKTFDSFDDVVIMLRTAREETSGFGFRKSRRGFFFTTVYRNGSGVYPAFYPKDIGAVFVFVMRQWHEAKCRLPSGAS